jgi:DNA repair exonuclease SbcCD ATPase subunit
MLSTRSYRRQLDVLASQYKAEEHAVRIEKKALSSARVQLQDAAEGKGILQLISQQVQETVHQQIAGVVSKCLECVFEEPYEFRILFENKRGRTEARLTFLREGQEVEPLEASGGGVVDVASFALMVASILLSRPASRRLLVADEPFKGVSANNRPNVRAMLEMLSKELGFQFIMVTHSHELRCGKVIEL